MTTPRLSAPILGGAVLVAAGIGTLAAFAGAQEASHAFDVDVGSTRREMAASRVSEAVARRRAEKLEAAARAITVQADRTANEAAALAARVQQTEAAIAAQSAQLQLISADREALRARMAERQAPLVRLTAALQRLSRRPPILSLLRTGSVQDQVYMRAMFDTMLPQVERRTAALRSEIGRRRHWSRHRWPPPNACVPAKSSLTRSAASLPP